nr:MAG TPA: hypothetical protein [Bacteriophage sp.]
MGEFASKGVAGSGLGLGIAGTALGVLAASQNGGLLGGLFGGGCGPATMGVIAEKDAKIAELTAQKYSDAQDSALYVATRGENKALRDEMMGFIRPLSAESAANRERIAVLETRVAKDAEISDLREKLVRSELGARIDTVAQTCACGISQNSAAIAALQSTVAGITRTVIPRTAICPEVMERWNSWTAPTATAPAVQPVTGTIDVQKG